MCDVSITLISKEVLKGDVYCIDPVTKAIVLKSKDNSYNLINNEGVDESKSL